ncbi:MAG: Ig-like domain-containing protein [Planctomycetota bacterium]
MMGGAILSQRDVTLINSTVSGNSTAGRDSYGGGVSSFGTATLINTLISHNSSAGDIAEGGGLIASTVILDGSEIIGNSTSGYRSLGGGLWANNATLAGSVVSGNGKTGDMSGGGGFYAADTATLTNTEVSDNSTSGNSAWGGGFGARTSIIEGSTVSGNSTSGESARGGGFWTYDLTLANSTISGNHTAGAISVGGGFWTLDASLVGTTVSGNSTTRENARGGGILSLNTLNLTNSLVLGNTTLFNGISSDDEVSLANGVLTFEGHNLVGATPQTFDASAANVDNADPLDIFAATIELLDETGAGTGANAGVLADNGGDVQTIALKDDPSNPAIDTGDATASISLDESVLQTDLNNDGDTDDTLMQVDDLAFDARGTGFDRISGSGIDLGAFEVNTPINQAPVALDDDVTTDEDTSLTISVLADNGNGADSDAQNNIVPSATRLIGSAPGQGELTNNGDGTFTFDPNGDFETLAADELELISFTYEIEDEFGETSQAQVNIQVTGANDAPVVQPLTAIADEEGPDVIVTADFVDADTSDSHVFSIDTTGTLGTVVSYGDGTFSYNPNGAFDLAGGETGTDSFTYTVDDGNGGVVTETVTVTIVARDISIDKFTNGVDADNPEDAVAVQAGDIIDWTYVVTNTGQIAFEAAEVVVTDDNGTPTITDDFSTLTGHIVLDASADIGNDGILSAGESWTYTASGIAANISLESVTIEAEHMHRRRYRVVHGSQASGERLVRLNNNSSNRPGKLWSYFEGESGTYDLKVTVQDENDGQSEIVVKVAGAEVGRILLDQDTDGAGSNNGGFSEFTLEDIAIESGDEFTLWVDGDGGELVRIDKLEFVAPPVFAMTVIDDSATIDYTLEAEDLVKWNYRTRNANQASGGKIARLRRAGTEGDLTTTFDCESGSYSLTLFAQDENDGQSEVIVKVAGQEVGRIQLDQDNDGEGSNHGPFSEFTLTDIQVNQGDQITLWVDGDGGEYVRIDKLELSRPFVLNSIQSIASVTAGGSTSAVDSSNYVNQTTMSMSGESHFGYWCIDEVEIYEDGYGDFADLYRFYDANGDLLTTVYRSDAIFGWDWSVGAWELEWNASQIGFDAEQVFFVSAQNFGEVESGLLQVERFEFN